MSVLLTILKILGIILLVIIGLVLLLLLTALLLPVRYRIHGEYEEDFHLEAKAGWLCRLLYFHFKMDNKEKIGILRICGIPIMQFPPDEQKEQRKKEKQSKKRARNSSRKTKKKRHKERAENQNTKQQEEHKQQMLAEKSQVQLIEDKESKISQPILKKETEDTDKKQDTKEKQTKEKQTKEKNSFFKRIQQFFIQIRQRLIQLPEKIKAAFSKIDDIKLLWMDENNKKSTSLILAEVKYLLLHYGPTKIHADIQFGTGDPGNTGKVLGILSLIPFLYQKDVHIVPDFVSEKLYLQGYMTGRGRIRMLHLIRTLLHFRKDKNLTTWIKDNL